MADDLPATEPHEDIEAKLSDYHEGTLAAAEREQVAAHLAGCAACRAAYAELERTLSALSGMRGQKTVSPPELTARVTETIHRRSAGRFFGRKTLGDRVPFGVLLIVALIVLGLTAAVLWSSTTGSLRTRPPQSLPPPAGGRVVPAP
jgi:anti-sigma factor RsiW